MTSGTVISIFIGASSFFLDVLVNTLIKEKRLFFDTRKIHTKNFTLPAGIVNQNWFDNFIPQRIRKNVRNVYKELMDGEIEPVEYYENPVVTKSGKERTIAWHSTVIMDEDNHAIGILGSGEDITEKLEFQVQLNQAQKMEAIGNLAGGISHDFNNILSPVIGFTELALDDARKGSILEDSLQEVYSAGKRAKDLVKQILAFARQSDEKIGPIQPSEYDHKGSFRIYSVYHTHHDRNPAGNRERLSDHGQCNPDSSGDDEPLHQRSPRHGGFRWHFGYWPKGRDYR